MHHSIYSRLSSVAAICTSLRTNADFATTFTANLRMGSVLRMSNTDTSARTLR